MFLKTSYLFVDKCVFVSGLLDVIPAKTFFLMSNRLLFQKHESEVLSVVERRRWPEQAEARRRRDDGMSEKKRWKKQEEEEGLHRAMVDSLNEGWSLLLRLMEKRQEVLTLASHFYRRAQEVFVSLRNG